MKILIFLLFTTLFVSCNNTSEPEDNTFKKEWAVGYWESKPLLGNVDTNEIYLDKDSLFIKNIHTTFMYLKTNGVKDSISVPALGYAIKYTGRDKIELYTNKAIGISTSSGSFYYEISGTFTFVHKNKFTFNGRYKYPTGLGFQYIDGPLQNEYYRVKF